MSELNAEYATLSDEQRKHVDAVAAETKHTGRSAKQVHGTAEYYAYPHGSGGTAWGIDDPINIKRGVKP